MRYLPPSSSKGFLAFFALFCLLLAGYRHLSQQLEEELARWETAVAEAEENLARYSRLLAGGDLQGELERKKGIYQELRELLPDHMDLPTFLTQLEGLAAATGISLLSLESLGTAREGDIAYCSLRLQLAGRYGELALFLEELAALPRLVKPGELHLWVKEFEGAQVQAELSLQVFYLPGANGDLRTLNLSMSG